MRVRALEKGPGTGPFQGWGPKNPGRGPGGPGKIRARGGIFFFSPVRIQLFLIGPKKIFFHARNRPFFFRLYAFDMGKQHFLRIFTSIF